LRKRFDGKGNRRKMKDYRKRTTIRDVAEKASVSISTVSHVLNDTRFVEEATRLRILALIKELNYRPNQFARGLRGAGSKTLGLIISDIREEFFSEITKAVESAANRIGYAVILCDSEGVVDKERLYLELLSEKGVEGIILAPVDSNVTPRLHDGIDFPMVQIDRHCRGAALDYIGIENARLASEAVHCLAALGNRRIGYLGHEASISTMEERMRGYESAMGELGYYDESLVNMTASRGEGARRALAAWIAAKPEIDAILCGNANICLSTLEALDDVTSTRSMALATFDDLACFRFMENPIACVRQPTERMGLAAFDALMSRIRGEAQASPLEILIPAELVLHGARAARTRAMRMEVADA
jgi:DNA-binding LacI/PurR family transcriptional regulator